MKLYRSILFLLSAVASAGGTASSAWAQPASARQAPEIHARFVPDTILIGDQFNLYLDIDKDVAQEIQLPRFEDGRLTPQIEVLGIDRIDTVEQSGRRIRIRVAYRLTGFDEGNYELGGFPVVWSATLDDAKAGRGDTVFAPEAMRLVVETFEIDTTQQQIFDIKRPLNTPFQWREIKEYLLWGGLIAVGLAVVIYLLVKYLRRGRKGADRSVVPPHVAAIRALERLHSRKLWQNGKHKEYYSHLADIVRIYIEGRYGIGAMEMTSDQILDAVREVNDERLCEKLRQLFRLADLVKFAKLVPSPEDNEQTYFDAYFYVEETKELPAPGEAPAAPGVTATEAVDMPEDDLLDPETETENKEFER
ncbi:hypothetical protein [uncultured Rikenella sp.]|uniref:hypothetical protein n=1 Tax=uncultured Rikenella sp. TaxID=368003 RepID=UPI0025DEDA77|nr:hypothetical protein [uncultured Rikenella sp.]